MCAKAVDVGTSFLVKGEIDVINQEPEFIVERNCFLKAASSDDTEDTLKENNWTYAKYGDEFYILGEDAIKIKNLLTIGSKDKGIVATQVGDLRRPMKNGILNTGEEKLSVAIIHQLLANLIGKPNHDGEVLCFCAPGDPVDRDLTVVFHRTMLTNFFKTLGYHVECIPEALAIIFSQRPVAEDPSEESGEAPFSGIAFSCLTPGQKVITSNGLVNIENIQKDDQVWTKNGRWKRVITPTSRNYSGRILTFESRFGKTLATTTEDHKWYVYKDNTWQWIEAKNVKTNDIVGIKCPNAINTDNHYPFINTYEKITNSKPIKKVFSLKQKGMRFLGYFLSDGCLARHDNEINFDFGNEDKKQIQDIQELVSELFNRKVWTHQDGGRTRCRFGFNGLAQWLRKHCYSEILGNQEKPDKIFPFDISKLNKSQITGLLQGLWLGDGNHGSLNGSLIEFYNSSSDLVVAFYLGCLALGFSPKIYEGDIEKDSNIRGRIVKRTKQPYTVHVSGNDAKLLKNLLINGRVFADKSFLDSYLCIKIGEIHENTYEGAVYDMQVEDDNSFCLPGITLHNCGGGMCNVTFSWKKMPLINFSIAQSGDWIDQEAAKVAGIDVSAMTRYKEKHLDLNNIDYSDMRQAGLDIFYQNMIEHALNNFAEKFNQLDSPIETPLEIVIAGGTASVPGFLDKFKSVISGITLPFKIKDIKLAENPFYAVSHGCLVKAISVENKKKKSNSTKSETKQEIKPGKTKLT